MLERRNFLTGLISALAAPAIVRASSIMPIRTMLWTPPLWTPPPLLFPDEQLQQLEWKWVANLTLKHNPETKIVRMVKSVIMEATS
jgi:hypothetical protein